MTMPPIHIHTQLDSTTLHLPQIEPLLGKRVEIIVQEEKMTPTNVSSKTVDWEAVQRAVESIQDYDFDAHKALDECDLRDSERRMQ